MIQSSSLDFIDLHGYPGGELDLAQIVENFGLTPVSRKPIVLGEFGAEHGPHPTNDDAVRALVGWQVEFVRPRFRGMDALDVGHHGTAGVLDRRR